MPHRVALIKQMTDERDQNVKGVACGGELTGAIITLSLVIQVTKQETDKVSNWLVNTVNIKERNVFLMSWWSSKQELKV